VPVEKLNDFTHSVLSLFAFIRVYSRFKLPRQRCVPRSCSPDQKCLTDIFHTVCWWLPAGFSCRCTLFGKAHQAGHRTVRAVPLQVSPPISNELAIRWLQQDQCTQPEHSACWAQQASQGASGRTGTECADLSAHREIALITRPNAFDTRCVRSLEMAAGVKALPVEFSVMDAAVTTNCW